MATATTKTQEMAEVIKESHAENVAAVLHYLIDSVRSGSCDQTELGRLCIVAQIDHSRVVRCLSALDERHGGYLARRRAEEIEAMEVLPAKEEIALILEQKRALKAKHETEMKSLHENQAAAESILRTAEGRANKLRCEAASVFERTANPARERQIEELLKDRAKWARKLASLGRVANVLGRRQCQQQIDEIDKQLADLRGKSQEWAAVEI